MSFAARRSVSLTALRQYYSPMSCADFRRSIRPAAWDRAASAEIKHVLHAGDVFAIDLRNAITRLCAKVFEVIPEASPNRLVTQAVGFGEFDYRTCERLERSSGHGPLGGLAQRSSPARLCP